MDGIPYAGLTDGDHWEARSLTRSRLTNGCWTCPSRTTRPTVRVEAPPAVASELGVGPGEEARAAPPPPPGAEGWALTELDPAGAQAPVPISGWAEAIHQILEVGKGGWTARACARGASLPSGRALHLAQGFQIPTDGFRSPVQLVYLETHRVRRGPWGRPRDGVRAAQDVGRSARRTGRRARPLRRAWRRVPSLKSPPEGERFGVVSPREGGKGFRWGLGARPSSQSSPVGRRGKRGPRLGRCPPSVPPRGREV